MWHAATTFEAANFHKMVQKLYSFPSSSFRWAVLPHKSSAVLYKTYLRCFVVIYGKYQEIDNLIGGEASRLLI